MVAALKGTIGKALTGVPQREERPMTLMAIEALTALISSGALFTAAGGLRVTFYPGLPGYSQELWAQQGRQALAPAAPHQREGAHDTKMPVCRARGERLGGVGQAAAHQRLVSRPPGFWRGLGDGAALCCPLPGGGEPCRLGAAPGRHWSASRTRCVASHPEQANGPKQQQQHHIKACSWICPGSAQSMHCFLIPALTADVSSVTLTKWLKIVGHTLAELGGCDGHHRTQSPVSDRVKSSSQAFQRRILAALPALTQSVGETVRKHVAS